MDRWLTVPIALLLPVAVAGLVFIACGDDDGGPGPGPGGTEITVPASWGGAWFVRITPALARGDTEYSASMLCPGADVVEAFGLFEGSPLDPADAVCEGVIGNTAAAIACALSGEIFAGCTLTETVTFEASRPGGGDQVTGTITRVIRYTGQCEGAVDDTIEVTFSAERFDTELAGCGDYSDTVPDSWGGHWDVTRTDVDCETGEPLGEPVLELGTLICPGLTVEEFFIIGPARSLPGGLPLEYAGGFTDTSADVFITLAGLDPQLGCEYVQTFRYQATRTGDTAQGTVTQTLRILGGGEFCPPDVICVRETFTATRVDTDTSECAP